MRYLFALALAVLASPVFAQTGPYPLFVAPIPAQTGSYAVSQAGTDLALTGGFVEVIPPGGSLLGYTVPQNGRLVWGFVKTPTDYLIFQSPVPIQPTLPFDRVYPIDVGTTRAGSPAFNEVLGRGHLVFDPDAMGNGKLIGMEVAFTTPQEFNGQIVTQLSLRFKRHRTDVAILACDRQGLPSGFSPPPPVNLCN